MEKPAYALPSMADVEALPRNGFTVASTFSGCGGSSLGYRMAGFKVLWANEFVPAARDTYRANAAPYTVLDDRDIREVKPGDVMAACGLAAGELDILDGSPPCASFSTAGNREADWGKVKTYSDTKQRTDDLFYEYARLVRDIQPRAFVAENVSGLVKGTAKGYFLRILAELQGCGYRVAARVLDAQWLGVPQARQRLIFVGVRNDLDRAPAHPSPLAYRYTVREALAAPSSRRVIHDTGGQPQYSGGDITDRPSPTVLTTPGYYRVYGDSAPPIDPETGKDISITRFAIGAEWARLRAGQISEKYTSLVRADGDRPCHTVTSRGGDISAASVTHPMVARKFTLAELRQICGFPADFVLTGTYEQRWERLGRAVPPPMMAAVASTIRDRILSTVDVPA